MGIAHQVSVLVLQPLSMPVLIPALRYHSASAFIAKARRQDLRQRATECEELGR